MPASVPNLETAQGDATLSLIAQLGVALMLASDLPTGPTPPPVPLPHFPDRLHAFVWRNWTLVPLERIAEVAQAPKKDILRMGKAMGLPAPPRIPQAQWRRTALTIIRRNWHLLPYEQLLQLLKWTPQQLAYTLREDDFLYIKLGSLKPLCEPIRYQTPSPETQRREREIAQTLRRHFPKGLPKPTSPLFAFLKDLKRTPLPKQTDTRQSQFMPRFCSSYFALYGDPLLEKEADPYPDAYLAQLAQAGVSGVWLQAVLTKLAPHPWEPTLSERYEERLTNLRRLIARAKRYGIGIYLYLNEPRAMPLAFFKQHPELKGVRQGDYATLCTSRPEVQNYLRDSIASICRAAPELAGFFTITASENVTSCWSHNQGAQCPLCSKRSPAEVIAEVNQRIQDGIKQSGAKTRLIAWDWGWSDEAAPQIIERLSLEIAIMSVSEWNLPIKRGGIESIVGEYSVSAIGPGPRSTKHWALARKRGLKVFAKIQAGNSWELSAVPYIPALENVAQHAINLKKANVDGLMLGWTLGGYPSPNLEMVSEVGKSQGEITAETAMRRVAEARYGATFMPQIVQMWRECSAAFREFPFHIGMVYTAPMQFGSANLLWGEATGYHATMIGFPYDDLDKWREVYPPEVFVAQFRKMAGGFQQALNAFRSATNSSEMLPLSAAIESELRIVETCYLHFQTTANQAEFVHLRRQIAPLNGVIAPLNDVKALLNRLKVLLNDEIATAKRLFLLQNADSRIGFEASNQYYYVPADLLEKIVNCEDLLAHWLPAQEARLAH